MDYSKGDASNLRATQDPLGCDNTMHAKEVVDRIADTASLGNALYSHPA